MNDNYKFTIKQDGIVVVKGFDPSLELAMQETAHYVGQYEQDGPIDSITIKRIKDKTK